MIIRTIIADDEQPARDLIKKFLESFAEIEVIQECSDGFSTVKAVNEKQPDLLFLDIQMPKLTGLEVLELLDKKPVVIFSTAYDQYAIQAFEMAATDYLLKPYSKDRFAKAIEKAKEKIASHATDEPAIKKLAEQLDDKSETLTRIAVRSGSKVHVIPSEKIYYLEADGDYVAIHSADGKFLKEKTMKYFESHLDNKSFARVHRSYIVNLNEIVKVELYDKENHMIILKNNQKIKASRSGYQLIKEILKI